MITAHVRAVITVEFDVGSWVGGASFSELNEQCCREAMQTIRSRMVNTAMNIVGEPKIKVSTFSEDGK